MAHSASLDDLFNELELENQTKAKAEIAAEQADPDYASRLDARIAAQEAELARLRAQGMVIDGTEDEDEDEDEDDAL